MGFLPGTQRYVGGEERSHFPPSPAFSTSRHFAKSGANGCKPSGTDVQDLGDDLFDARETIRHFLFARAEGVPASIG